MARKFERFYSEGKGNGLRAVDSIRAGELLFTAEPFACAVSKRAAATVCDSCFTRKERLLRCSRCKTAHYCNTGCQKHAWLEHKRECNYLFKLYPQTPPDSVRLVARIIFSLLNHSPHPSEDLYSVQELESHLEDMSEQRRQGLEHLHTALQLYLKEDGGQLSQLPPGLDPISLFARVTCNCFTVSDAELREVGVGLYPSMSLLNHNCRPNCVMMFEGTRLHLRPIRDIQSLEELTISYIDILMPSMKRREQLQEQYHFLCQCEHCTSAIKDMNMVAGEEDVWKAFIDAIPRLEQLQSQQQWDEMLAQCRALLDGCGDAVPDENVHLLRLLDLGMDACINTGQWEAAVAFGVRTLQPYRSYYPEPHPSRAVQLMRVGKLQHYLGRLDDAQMTLREANDVMKVTHGHKHALTSEVGRMLEECLAGMGGD